VRAAAIGLVLLFVGVHWRAARFGANWWTDRSLRIKNVVQQVLSAHQAAPAKTILLSGINEEIYTGAMRDRAFAALGAADVYMDRESAEALPRVYSESAQNFVLDRASLAQLSRSGKLLVLSVDKPVAQDITASYQVVGDVWPNKLELFRPVAEQWLGPTWHNIEPTHRWMPKSATAKLRAPKSPEEKLRIKGYCPPEQVSGQPLRLRVLVNGRQVGSVISLQSAGPVELVLPLPAEEAGIEPMEITLEVDRTFRPPGDIRDLGLAVSSIEIR
jgi:hypothetical protein